MGAWLQPRESKASFQASIRSSRLVRATFTVRLGRSLPNSTSMARRSVPPMSTGLGKLARAPPSCIIWMRMAGSSLVLITLTT